ncbi:MAG: polyhydroxyalkanoate synthesis repressor PhaR [Candidatus Thiosymbion ectosymbiont of Robbea hypermnestra]|nr:polyhydroxyalkanoate synthesis repressor PhaR [Candidatus Thiosymbion ectosymbiont of Robbea hypermnestra]
MSDERIIKKYPNRRLYDTEVSKYITVVDVRDLVMRGDKFRVVDTTNEEDITRSILLQIMLEEESAGKPLFTANMLAQIIRFYGGTLRGLFARYMEQSLNVFAKQQQQVRETLAQDPLQTVTRMTQRSVEMWTDFQKEFLRAAGLQSDGKTDKADSSDPSG